MKHLPPLMQACVVIIVFVFSISLSFSAYCSPFHEYPGHRLLDTGFPLPGDTNIHGNPVTFSSSLSGQDESGTSEAPEETQTQNDEETSSEVYEGSYDDSGDSDATTYHSETAWDKAKSKFKEVFVGNQTDEEEESEPEGYYYDPPQSTENETDAEVDSPSLTHPKKRPDILWSKSCK